MLSENIKRARKAKGLTQEELALQLHIVRQTVSKWEKGLSTPDSEMLLILSEKLDEPVSALLGETIPVCEDATNEICVKEISEKLSGINTYLAKTAERKRRILRVLSCMGLALVFGCTMVKIISLLRLRTFCEGIENVTVGTMGGADGPSAVFVAASKLSGISGHLMVLVLCIILLLSLLGIVISHKKAL